MEQAHNNSQYFYTPSSLPNPVTFTPTDAAHLSKSYVDKDEEDNFIEEKRPLIPKKASRQPIMHPRWYSASPRYNSALSSSPGIPEEPSGELGSGMHSTNSFSHDDLHHLSAMFNRHKYYRKLVHPLDERMSIPDHVLPSSLFYIIPTKHTGKQNSLVSIFAIWNTMMGTSLLTIPWGLQQSGFALGVFLLIFMGSLTFYTAYRVLLSKDTLVTPVFEFSDVCKHYLGRCGEWLAIIFALLTFLGGLIVYWVLMSNFLYTGGIFIYDSASNNHVNSSNPEQSKLLCPTGYPLPPHNNSRNHSFFLPSHTDDQQPHKHTPAWSLNFTVPLYLALVLFPLLSFKSPTFFTKFNSLGTLSTLFVVAFTITKASMWGWNYQFTIHRDPTGMQSPDFKLSFTALTGLLSLAFFLHNALITILKNNKHPENNVRDLSAGYALVALTYLTVGVSFYLSFPLPKECIAANFLDNLHSSDVFASVVRLLLLFQILTVYPLLAYMFRVNALYAIFKKAWPGLWQVIVINLLLVAVCVLVAIFYPHIGDLIRYSGALCGMVYVFCLPSLVYMLSMKSQGKLTRMSVIVHSAIILFGILNFISQFIAKPTT